VDRYYDKQNKRLVYIGESASPDFWDRLFDTENFRETIERGKNDRFILKILKKYIPDKKERILEGGCGGGRIIYCMHVHGYKSIGIDSAKKTVDRLKKIFSELDVRIGDVSNLQFPDNYFIGYWSIGVIEHFWRGYHDVLKEMRRVLVDGGYIFLSFPYMSPLRRLKAKLGLYQEFADGGEGRFYQFALNVNIVIRELEANGFRIIEERPLAGIKGLKDEVSLFKSMLQGLFSYKGTSLWIRGLRFLLDMLLAPFTGHTIFLVLKKSKLGS